VVCGKHPDWPMPSEVSGGTGDTGLLVASGRDVWGGHWLAGHIWAWPSRWPFWAQWFGLCWRGKLAGSWGASVHGKALHLLETFQPP